MSGLRLAAGPRRILVLSASVGGGHLRAAEAVEAACRLRHPEAEVRNLDVLTLTPAPFRRLYARGYLDLVNHSPEPLGLLYDRTNRAPRGRTAERLPGQETRNATMLYEEGAAISGENPFTVGQRVARLLASPERLDALRRNARRLGRPQAAAAVAEQLGRLALSARA